MSGLTPPGPGPESWPAPGAPTAPAFPVATEQPAASEPPGPNPAIRDALTSVSVVVGWFAVAAVIAAVVWWQVTPLAEFTRTSNNATMDEEQLAKQFGTEGWFFVIAAVAGLVSGAVLVLLRRRNPVLMVVLVTLGGAFATLVMVELGLLLGPSDPASVLASTPVGGKVPLQLKLDAHGLWFIWSIAALVGAIIALWTVESREASRLQRELEDGYRAPERLYPNAR